MPITSSPSSNTTSGITTAPSGVRHIPSSVRADGSTRKEIKVRPGYRPPEDVELYKNRTAEAWKTRGSGGVPGAEGLKDNKSQESNSNTKNAKRREARKRAKAGAEAAADGDEKGDGEQAAAAAAVTNGELNQQSYSSPKVLTSRNADVLQKENWRSESEPVDPTVEREKQVRNLKKKLRQARELREKKDNGEALLPEQFEKVIKINELIRQLHGLGFDAEGELKRD